MPHHVGDLMRWKGPDRADDPPAEIRPGSVVRVVATDVEHGGHMVRMVVGGESGLAWEHELEPLSAELLSDLWGRDIEGVMPRITITTYNLQAVERQLCVEALDAAGTIVDAASLLGITRHALKKRIIKHNIAWPPRRGVVIRPGDRVRYWTGTREGPGKVGVSRTGRCVLGGHTAGVYVIGAGFVAMTHVIKDGGAP